MNIREQASAKPADNADPRYASARDAAVRSFFNRFGRFPTEDEFRQSIGHFLPVGVTMSSTQIAREGASSSPGEQVAQSGSFDPPVAVALEPGASKAISCGFGRGRYEAWARMVVQDTPSANFRKNTLHTRPLSLPRPSILVALQGELLSAGRSRALELQLSADDRIGQAINHGLNVGAFDGPGHVRLDATNRGPFAVDLTLGIRPAR